MTNHRLAWMLNAGSTSQFLQFFVMAILLPLAGVVQAKDYFSVAAWNLEHLNEQSGNGCVQRTDADYGRIADQIRNMKADVIAFQEVESESAASRVFPDTEWTIVVSDRPNTTGVGRECRGMKGQHLRHLATGIAIRSGLNHIDHPDLSALGIDGSQRWGTDVTVEFGIARVRFLSVHLASGCWGSEQDRNSSRARVCSTLRRQIGVLSQWMQSRAEAGEDFIVLGDFNRRLALADDWAWNRLSTTETQARLITELLPARCDSRYKALIDHLVASEMLANRVIMDRLVERPRQGNHPDHCAIQAFLR